jgi:hypothetical protein
LKKLNIKIGILGLSFMSPSVMAQDRQYFSLAALGNLSNAKVPDSVESGESIETDNGFGFGAALGFGHMISDGVSIETGVSLFNRQRIYGNDNFRLKQTEWNLRIPLIGKLHLGRVFALGVGPYIGIPLGNVKNTFETGNSSSPSFDTDNSSKVELGALASATLTVPFSDTSGLFFEARYLRGLTDLARDNSQSSFSDDIESLIGYRVSL